MAISTPATLYYRVPAANWREANRKNIIRNPEGFLKQHRHDVRYVTVVSATGSYAVTSIELHDDPVNGTFDREFILEFDTRDAALTWLAAQGIAEYVTDYAM